MLLIQLLKLSRLFSINETKSSLLYSLLNIKETRVQLFFSQMIHLPLLLISRIYVQRMENVKTRSLQSCFAKKENTASCGGGKDVDQVIVKELV